MLTSETTDLSTTFTTGLVVSSGDTDFFEKASTGGFLPAVKIEQKGRRDGAPAGNWVTGKDDDQEDLGPEIDVLVWARRAKAVDLSDEKNVRESFDSKSELFQEIHAEAQKPGMNGYMSGPSFLVQTREGDFFELFCTSKTAQKESGKIAGYLPVVEEGREAPPKPCTLKSIFIEDKRRGFSWYGPKAVRCATPFEAISADAVVAKIQEFLNPPVRKVEEVEDATGGRAV